MEAGAAEGVAATSRSDGPKYWAAPRRDSLLWLEDGASTVVFDRRSGQTHILNATAAQALGLLMNGPLPEAELSRQMALNLDPDADMAALVREILSTFDALGLVEPAGL